MGRLNWRQSEPKISENTLAKLHTCRGQLKARERAGQPFPMGEALLAKLTDQTDALRFFKNIAKIY